MPLVRYAVAVLLFGATLMESAADPPRFINGPDGISLPCRSLDQVLFAQISDSNKEIRSALVGSRSYIWGGHIDSVKKGIYAGYYYPSMRDFNKEHTLQWWQINKPDWIAYQADRKTPACEYVYSWGSYMGLDITRNDVREYILNTYLIPASDRGFPEVSFDNVSIENGGHWSGVWRNGSWVQLFGERNRDDAFAAAILDYIKWMRRELHARKVALALNAKLDADQEDLTWRLISLGDIWLDEGGFSQDSRHHIVDDTWRLKFELAQRQAKRGVYVSMNTLAGPFAAMSDEERAWVLANFLLVRGAQSYLAVLGKSDEGKLLDYTSSLNPPVGLPVGDAHKDGNVYLRSYEHGLAVVNPSSHQSASFPLPSGRWLDSTGKLVPATLVLPPRSGRVLIAQ